jgi:Ni/Co efflux regulator RcnB
VNLKKAYDVRAAYLIHQENDMKKLILTIFMTTFCFTAYAGPQQDKMKACNADASKQTLTGDARKAFMKDCLSTKNESTMHSQQDKMKMCNADAGKKELKGDERKAFMKDCLSSKHDPSMTTQQNKMKTCNADPKAKTLKGDERKAFMKSCLSGS